MKTTLIVLDQHTTKVELVQQDGISVAEKIITFFEGGFNALGVLNARGDAEMLYNACVQHGKIGGVEAFDQCVEVVCKELNLDSNELAQRIANAAV